MRRILMLAIFWACVLQPSVATETNQQTKKGGKPPPTEVQMPFLIAPVSVGGEFLGYQYIASIAVTPSAGASQVLRGKLAFVQDALVRDVYRSCVSLPDDPKKVDKTALAERLAAVIRRIVGARNVVKLVFIDVKFAPLHPPPDGRMFEEQADEPAPAASSAGDGKGKSSPPATSQHEKDSSH
jgi:hypothetical protein